LQVTKALLPKLNTSSLAVVGAAGLPVPYMELTTLALAVELVDIARQ
jgi:hypothetical protein